MGGLGLRPWEIDRLDSEDIEHYVKGYRNQQKAVGRTIYEAGRLAGFMAVLPYVPKHVRSANQIIKFDWDAPGVSDMEEHTEDHREWVVKQDKKDILSGRIKEGTRAYEEAIKRIEAYGD